MSVDAWSDYWSQGSLNSFADSSSENYGGVILSKWTDWLDQRKPSKDASILDIGCGNGALLELLKPYFEEGGELVGVDISNVSSSSHDFNIISGHGAESLPFEDGRFDYIVSQFGIEYSRTEEALKEVQRCLKERGFFQFFCHSKDSVILNESYALSECYKRIINSDSHLNALRMLSREVKLLRRSKAKGKAEAENYRLLLNNGTKALLEEYGEVFYLTRFHEVIQSVMSSTSESGLYSAEEILELYERDIQSSIERLSDLFRSAMDMAGVDRFCSLAVSEGLKVEVREAALNERKQKIGWVISGGA